MRRLTSALAVVAAVAGGGLVTAVPASADTSGVTVQVSASPQVQQQVTVSGHVTGQDGMPAANAPISASRYDARTGTTAVLVGPGATDSNGDYSFQDIPDVRGSVTWTVSLTSDNTVTGSATVTVAGKQASLTVAPSHSRVTTGTTAHVTVTLGPSDPSGPTNRTVTLYAKPYGFQRKEIASGDGTAGGADADFRVVRRTSFVAVYHGDDVYSPMTVTALVKARAVIAEALRRSYETVGAYRLYHHDVNPALVARLAPASKGRCLHFRAERRYNGAWHRVAVSACVDTDSQGMALGVLTGYHVVGDPYRLRAEWRGNTALLPAHGAWMLLRFKP
jgi:hypothetical protein